MHQTRISSHIFAATLLLTLIFLFSGCAVFKLAGYAINPAYPDDFEGQVVLQGLQEPVNAYRRPDGIWRIEAQNETDLMFATGYLQARDRMFQLDLLRNMATGRLAEMVGVRQFGKRTTVELDTFNRFMGFAANAQKHLDATSEEERTVAQAFVNGINAWIETGMPSLEHQLLGIDQPRAWTQIDSISIYTWLMYGLSGNWPVEARRLLLACDNSIESMQRIWPTDIDFGYYGMGADDTPPATHTVHPAIVPEVQAELPALCDSVPAQEEARSLPSTDPQFARAAAMQQLIMDGLVASNNWIIHGSRTESGGSILADDPHLPHMNPPIVWGVEQKLPGHTMAGFTLPGLHRVVFGRNNKVAWGATTNYMDRQDLYLLKGNAETYEFDGEQIPYEVRTETIQVRNDDPVEVSVRYTRHGVVLQDIDSWLGQRLPLVAIAQTDIGPATDLNGAHDINYANTAVEWSQAIMQFQNGCINWVFADADNIGYRSPCRVPIRNGWDGHFPVPGWTSTYLWGDYYPRDELPASDNPERGWMATANNPHTPRASYSTILWGDPAPTNRVKRIGARIEAENKHTLASARNIQLDVDTGTWQRLRIDSDSPFCATREEEFAIRDARAALCNWNGTMASELVQPTILSLMVAELIERVLFDEIKDLDAEEKAWLQHLPKFETPTQRLLGLHSTAPEWDDVNTPKTETRMDQLEAAFHAAAHTATERWGDDIAYWRWGVVRPFVVHHLLTPKGGMLGELLDANELPGIGGATSVFKNQFYRDDNETFKVEIGPVVRFTIDMATPETATFSLAGGNSGWPKSPWNANLVDEWRYGHERLLTPPPSQQDILLELVPGE